MRLGPVSGSNKQPKPPDWSRDHAAARRWRLTTLVGMSAVPAVTWLVSSTSCKLNEISGARQYAIHSPLWLCGCLFSTLHWKIFCLKELIYSTWLTISGHIFVKFLCSKMIRGQILEFRANNSRQILETLKKSVITSCVLEGFGGPILQKMLLAEGQEEWPERIL